MKKVVSLALSLAMALSLAACGGSNDNDSSAGVSTVSSVPVEPQKMILATGDVSGTYYAVGCAMEEALNGVLTLTELEVASTGASKANVNLITDGEAELAILQSDMISYAHAGSHAFAGTGAEDNALWVAGLYPETVQIIARKDITDVSQLAGKTVCVGDIGSGTRVNAEQILAAYGMTVEDVDAVPGSFQEGMKGFRSGKYDAVFVVAGAPTKAITDLAATDAFNMLSLGEEALGYIEANYPFLVRENLPANTYEGVEEEVRCVAVQAALAASDTVSEDAVYELLQAMFDNKAKLEAGHEKFRFLDLENAVDSACVPLHPGAVKFYRETGALH